MSWLIEAIERAALEQARLRYKNTPTVMFVYGQPIRPQQVVELVKFYQKTTGKKASDIPYSDLEPFL